MNLTKSLPTVAAVLFAALAGSCSSPMVTSANDSMSKVKASAAAAQDPKTVCVQMFERERACTDVFIPGLVDARIRQDKPPGVREAAAKEGRDPLIAKAKEEWANDSKPEAIDATCTKIAGSMSPDEAKQMTATVNGCLASPECQGFTSCVMPLLESKMH